jgi:excisionase family DNA binding protein
MITSTGTPLSNEDRIKALFAASPDILAAVDAALTRQPAPEQRPCLRLLRMGQAAKETGLSRCTLWRAIRDGRLRSVEVRRGSRRISEAELRRFVGVQS